MFLPALLPSRQHGPPDGGRTLFRGASIDLAILAEDPRVWTFHPSGVRTLSPSTTTNIQPLRGCMPSLRRAYVRSQVVPTECVPETLVSFSH